MRVIGTVGSSVLPSRPLQHMLHGGGGLVVLVEDLERAQVHAIPDRINRKLGKGGLHARQRKWTHGHRETDEVQAHDLGSDSSSNPGPSTILRCIFSERGQDPFRIDRDRENGEILEGQRNTQVHHSSTQSFEHVLYLSEYPCHRDQFLRFSWSNNVWNNRDSSIFRRLNVWHRRLVVEWHHMDTLLKDVRWGRDQAVTAPNDGC